MPALIIAVALLLSGCGCDCTPQTVARQAGEPQEAGSINCTIDARHCAPGQRR